VIQATDRVAFWKIVVVALCLCVFLFSTHARLMQYQLPSTGAELSASSKLWDSDQRMEIQAVIDLASAVVLAILSWMVFSLRACILPLAFFDVPSPLHTSAHWHVRRFFRPPPIL